MDKFDTALKEKAQTLGYPDFQTTLRDMKDTDIQKLLEFLVIEVGELTVRVSALEKSKV